MTMYELVQSNKHKNICQDPTILTPSDGKKKLGYEPDPKLFTT